MRLEGAIIAEAKMANCIQFITALIVISSIVFGCNPDDKKAPQTAVVTDAKPAWQQPTAFQNFKFGEDIRKTLPPCPGYFRSAKEPCFYAVTDRKDGTEAIYIAAVSIGDIALEPVALQLEEQLIWLSAEFEAADADRLIKIFKERYGEPHQTEGEELQSGMGVKVHNRRYRWTGTNVHIEIAERESKTDRGAFYYTTARWRQYAEERRQKQITEAAKTL
jgi:hypothetical protein